MVGIMKDEKDRKLKPLPGSRQAHTKGMFPFVINLREQLMDSASATKASGNKSSTKNSSSTSRRAVHDQYSSVTQTFIEHLQRELQEQELVAEVAGYGEPNPFPVITLTCSERVASVIEKMPEVLDIYRDDEPSLGIVEKTTSPKVSFDS